MMWFKITAVRRDGPQGTSGGDREVACMIIAVIHTRGADDGLDEEPARPSPLPVFVLLTSWLFF